MVDKSKGTKSPADLKGEEFDALVLSIAELLRDARTDDDRRNFVMTLKGEGLQDAEIVKVSTKAFNAAEATIKGDLAWVEKYWTAYGDRLRATKGKADVLGYNAAVLKRAMAKGDVATANRANEHRARLLRLE